jgi:outer membrane murein-binding lipoprotein Lpp
MSVDRQKRAFALGALVLSALALAGCSSPIADLPSLGAPADLSAKPKDASTYLPVHDLPPQRDEAVIPPDQRAKIESELIAARDRQASAAQNANGK